MITNKINNMILYLLYSYIFYKFYQFNINTRKIQHIYNIDTPKYNINSK